MYEVIIALLGLLTALVGWFAKSKTSNDTAQKYISIAQSTIEECVRATNQLYVDPLKQTNHFSKEAQQMAFDMTYEKIMTILSDGAKNVLISVYGDLDLYIKTKIEAEVKANK